MAECVICGSAIQAEGVCDSCGELPAETERLSDPSRPQPLPLELAPGDVFAGRYRIIEEIGRGGMGHVVKAVDRAVGQTVAVKLIRPELGTRLDVQQRFRRELALAREVTHPNVCRVFDLGEHQGQLYISMSHIEGQTLEALIGAVGALSPRQTLTLGRQLAAGLAAIHRKGIVHRDLKPSNVMVDREGQAILMDFGVARHRRDARLTSDGTVMGTLAYLAPELAGGNPADPRSDVFALGLVLYEMVVGRYPPGSELPVAMRRQTPPFPPPSELSPEIPPALEAVVLRALAWEPGERHPDATALLRDLEAIPEPVSEEIPRTPTPRPPTPGGSAPIPPPHRRRHPAKVGLALLAILVALSTAIGRRGSPPLPENPVLAVAPFGSSSGDASLAHLGVGLADVLGARLAALPGLRVVHPPPGAGDGQGEVDVARLARDLGADLVLLGALEGSLEKLRVTLGLHEAAGLRWHGEFEGSRASLPELQARLAARVAAELRALTPAERQQLARPGTPDPTALEQYSQARELLQRRDVSTNARRASALLESAVEADPGFALAHAARAEAYWARYRDSREADWADRARDAILEALRLDAADPRIRLRLAEIYAGTGRGRQSEDELRRLIRARPESDAAHRLLGVVLRDRGDAPEEAEASLRRAIDLRPAFWEGHRELGFLLFQSGRLSEARDAYRRITELQPDNAWGFQTLGTVNHVLGDREAAIAAYERAIQLGATPYAWSNLGTLHYEAEQYDEAVAAYEEARALRPGDPELHHNLGDALSGAGRSERARASYEAAVARAAEQLEVTPGDVATVGLLATCEAKLGRRDAARRRMRTLVDGAPDDPEAFYQDAVVKVALNELEQAAVALARAGELGYPAALIRADPLLKPVVDRGLWNRPSEPARRPAEQEAE